MSANSIKSKNTRNLISQALETCREQQNQNSQQFPKDCPFQSQNYMNEIYQRLAKRGECVEGDLKDDPLIIARNQKKKASIIKRLSGFSNRRSSNLYNRRFSANISNPSSNNQIHSRKTCKMFNLNYNTDHLNSEKTLNNLLMNLEINKFNQIEELNKESIIKDKSCKVLNVTIPSRRSESNVRIRENQKNNKFKNEPGMTKKRRSERQTKSRFSILQQETKAKQFFQVQKDFKLNHYQESNPTKANPYNNEPETKFVELSNFQNISSKNRLLRWKKWKQQQKNNHIKLMTKKITNSIMSKNSHKSMFDQKMQIAQRQLKRFEIENEKVSKFKSNNFLIKQIKQENSSKIDQYFSQLQNEIIQSTNLLIGNTCCNHN